MTSGLVCALDSCSALSNKGLVVLALKPNIKGLDVFPNYREMALTCASDFMEMGQRAWLYECVYYLSLKEHELVSRLEMLCFSPQVDVLHYNSGSNDPELASDFIEYQAQSPTNCPLTSDTRLKLLGYLCF